MKKRILSIVLSIVMLVGLLPTTALAADTHSSHYSCGVAGCTADHGHNILDDWTAWDGTDAKPFVGDIQLEAGNYYLTGNLTLSNTIRISGTVNLCLNGHTISNGTNSTYNVIEVSSGATLNICDCQTTAGSIISNSADTYGECIDNYHGTVNVYGGNIRTTGNIGNGIYNDYGTVNVYDGSISAASGSNYYGIYNYKGTVNVYDGSISATDGSNYGISNYSGTATVSGGTVSGSSNGIQNTSSDASLTISGSASVIGGNYGINNYNGKLQLSGAPTINGEIADISLEGSTTPTIDIVGVLTNTEKYMVTTYQKPAADSPVVFTSTVDEENAAKFESANSDYQVLYADGVLKLTVKPAHTTHPICGAAHTDIGDHTGTCENVDWTAWDGTGTPSGNVCLTGNVTLTDTLAISTGTVNLCLNGHSITNATTAISVNSGATLNICDCGTVNVYSGTVSSSTSYGINNSGTVNVYSGTVSSKSYGIYNKGTVNIYGGTVSSSNTTGIYNANTSSSTTTVNIYGGEVSGAGYGINNGSGTVNVYGGTVTGANNGIANGSNVNNVVNVSGGTVTGNGSGVYGYGITNLGNGTLKLSGNPTITGNKADIYLEDNTSTSTITITAALTYAVENAISVKMDSAGTFTTGWTTMMGENADYDSYFTSASSVYTVQPDGNGELKLAKPTIPVTNVVLDKSKIDLYLGKTNTATLIASVEPNNATDKTVSWTSSDPTVAKVENGLVTALNPGSTTITVTANDGSGKSATCAVTVTVNKIAITGPIAITTTQEPTVGQTFVDLKWIEIPNGNYKGMGKSFSPQLSIKAGIDYTLSVELKPNDGYYFADDVTATVNGKAATVERSGDNIFIKYTYSFASPAANSVDILYGGSSADTVPVELPGVAQNNMVLPFTAKVLDQYGGEMTGQTVEWSITGTNTAGIIVNNGTVTVTKDAAEGEYTLTATCGGKFDSITIQVKKAESVLTTVKIFDGGGAGNEIITVDRTIPDVGIKSYINSVAKGYDQYGEVMTGLTFTWSNTNTDPEISLVNGYVTISSGAQKGNFSYTASCNGKSATVTVNLTKKMFTVTYTDNVANETVFSDVQLSVQSGGKAPVYPNATPTRTGYIFAGWYTSTDGGATLPTSAYDFDTPVTGNLTLYAKWTLDTPVISAVSGYNGKYDGENHEISVTVSTVSGIDYSYQWYNGGMEEANKVDGAVSNTYSVKDVADSGTYYCKVTATDGKQTQTVWSEAITSSIEKRNITLTSATVQKEFDGKLLKNDDITVTGDGFVSGEGAECVVTGTQMYVGSSKNTFTYDLTDGTNADNYAITTEAGTLTVTNRTEKYWITVEANSGTFEYNTAEHTVSGLKQTVFEVEGNTYTVSGLTATASGTDAVIIPVTISGSAIVKDENNVDVTDQFEITTQNGTLTITKANENAITDFAIEIWTYGESAKSPTASATFGTPSFTYVGTGGTVYTESTTPPENAGTYKVIAKVAETTNFAGASDEKTFTIEKATPSISAPTANTGLIYDGNDKALVNAGTTSGGEMQYSLDGNTWGTAIPQGNSAGSYTVHYKVVGGNNYNDNAGDTVQVTIAKAAQLAPETPAAVNETIKAKADGKITGVTSVMEYKSEGANEYTAISETEIVNLAAGTYLVRYKENANHFAGTDKQIIIAEGAMITITFNSNEGTAVDSITCEYNQAITAPAEPTKEEFEFVGWYLEDTLTTKWTNEYQFTADTTLYAKWVQGTVSDHEDHVDEIEADGLNDVAKAEETDIKLVVQVEEATEGDSEQTAIKGIADAPNNFGFYDITLEKSSGGYVTNASSVIEIKLPYDFTRKTNIKVYRYHSGASEELAQLDASATAHYVDGKCYVDKSNNCIYIYSSKFSTYAVAYDTVRSSSGGGTTRYTVKFDTDGGSSISNATVNKNAKVTEPKAPEKDGYTFGGWYTDEELTEKYDFESKVTKNFTLFAKWDKHDDEQSGTDTHNCPSKAFDDLDITKWYHLDTDYVIENGIFKGTTETTFEPDSAQTRAMMVTVLYRAEGEPAVNRSIPFADVDMGAYYANAVIWGQQNGIIKGYSETEFAPDQNITREQIAAIMHRYAQYKEYDVSVGENTNILSYDDFADISEYAISSMQWACGSGLIKGRTESTLNPKDNATRAEIAAILHRFIETNK